MLWIAKSVLNAVSCWSLHVVSWVVTNVLDDIRFRFIESLPSWRTREKKLLLLAVSDAMIWMMKLSREKVESNQEFQGLSWSFVSGNMWGLLYSKPG